MSGVTDFSWAFSQYRDEAGGSQVVNGNSKAKAFVGTDISKWITTSVTSLLHTFFMANAMNSDLSKWNVAKVKSLQGTFQSAFNFAGTGLNSWITTSVTSLDSTFVGAVKMNADLSGWSVGKVTTMKSMFLNAHALTSCSKRLIADVWMRSAAAVAFSSWNTAWAGETCPKVREE